MRLAVFSLYFTLGLMAQAQTAITGPKGPTFSPITKEQAVATRLFEEIVAFVPQAEFSEAPPQWVGEPQALLVHAVPKPNRSLGNLRTYLTFGMYQSPQHADQVESIAYLIGIDKHGTPHIVEKFSNQTEWTHEIMLALRDPISPTMLNSDIATALQNVMPQLQTIFWLPLGVKATTTVALYESDASGSSYFVAVHVFDGDDDNVPSEVQVARLYIPTDAGTDGPPRIRREGLYQLKW